MAQSKFLNFCKFQFFCKNSQKTAISTEKTNKNFQYRPNNRFPDIAFELLRDEFPGVYRFVSCVFPSEADSDDVVVSPYNAVLACRAIAQSASCVLPVCNDALLSMCARPAEPDLGVRGRAKPFDEMNSIVARVLNNLTAGMRFEGSLNVDLNEITTNLVPYPDMHFLVPALSPLLPGDARAQPRGIDQMFSDACSPSHQLLHAGGGGSSVTLAQAFLVRGAVSMHDVERNIDRIKRSIKMLPFNRDAFKVGLCQQPPLGQPCSVLSLSNSSAVRHTFARMRDRYLKTPSPACATDTSRFTAAARTCTTTRDMARAMTFF